MSGDPRQPDAQVAANSAATGPPCQSNPWWRQAVLHPDLYIWYVLFASMDLMLTWKILKLDGYEVNPLADWVLQKYDMPGLVLYKYALVIVVVTVIEFVGRAKPSVGRRLAEWSVAITFIPVGVALTLLYYKLRIEPFQ